VLHTITGMNLSYN